MTSTLSPSRQRQLRLAHIALDNGDKARAIDCFALDLDGFMGRVKAVFERIDRRKYADKPVVFAPKREAVGAVPNKGTAQRRAVRDEAIREVLRADPMTETKNLCTDFDVNDKVIWRIRKELGITAPAIIRAEKLMKAYVDLIAERGQISDITAAEILGQSKGTMYDVRMRYYGTKRKR
jgi:hypothetical protein